MCKLNNKGQSLILFILVLPILFGIMALVYDVGNALNKKAEVDNVIEMILNLDNYKKEDIEVLLEYNLEKNNNKIIIDEDVIIIKSNTYVRGILSNILNVRGFKIESEYKKYISDNKKVEKIK